MRISDWSSDVCSSDLFDREGTRKPKLTTAGRAVLAEARAVSTGIDGLRAKVKGLLEGLEAEVDLAVDVLFPAERLARVLRAFANEYPTVSLRLNVEAQIGRASCRERVSQYV